MDFSKNKQLKKVIQQNLQRFDNDTLLTNTLKNKDIVLGYITHTEENIFSSGILPKPIAIKSAEAIKDSILYTMDSYTGNINSIQESAKYGVFLLYNLID